MPIKLSCPRTPPSALMLNPNPTTKNVKDEMAITRIVLSKITLFYFILIEPVSFIMNPTWAKITITTTMTTHTVSRMSVSTFIRFVMLTDASFVYYSSDIFITKLILIIYKLFEF